MCLARAVEGVGGGGGEGAGWDIRFSAPCPVRLPVLVCPRQEPQTSVFPAKAHPTGRTREEASVHVSDSVGPSSALGQLVLILVCPESVMVIRRKIEVCVMLSWWCNVMVDFN